MLHPLLWKRSRQLFTLSFFISIFVLQIVWHIFARCRRNENKIYSKIPSIVLASYVCVYRMYVMLNFLVWLEVNKLNYGKLGEQKHTRTHNYTTLNKYLCGCMCACTFCQKLPMAAAPELKSVQKYALKSFVFFLHTHFWANEHYGVIHQFSTSETSLKV